MLAPLAARLYAQMGALEHGVDDPRLPQQDLARAIGTQILGPEDEGDGFPGRNIRRGRQQAEFRLHPLAFGPPGDFRALAHEARGEAGRRAGIDPLRRAGILDPSLVHDHDQARQSHGLFLVVGDMDEAAAGAALQGQELVLHLAAEIEVEGAQRLVQQEDLRLHDEGAGQSHTLALAARELMHAARPEAGEPDHIEGPLDPLMALFRRHAPELQPEADIPRHRHMGKQSVILEHRRRRAHRRAQPRHVAPCDPDAARGGKGEAADHREQRGLAAARGAQEHDIILASHGERDIVQRHHLAIELADSFDRQMRRSAHRRFLNSSSSTTIMSRMEQRKMKEPAALVSAFTPPLSRLRITTGKVTSKRVFSSAIRVSSQEKVKQRQKAAMRAGAIIGAVMLTSTRRVEAPRSRAAASIRR